MLSALRANFQHHFNAEPDYLVRSPGRVNIIGEHTDYNDGFVLPMALQKATYLAFSLREDQKIILYSDQRSATLDLKKLQAPKYRSHWSDYVQGVAHYLMRTYSAHYFTGFNACIATELPIGAGLSSSAAFELAIARALALGGRLNWNPVKVARLCQKAENHWVKVNCGIMDQLICATGQADHACLLDCRSDEITAVPLPNQTVILIMDTTTRRGLVGSAYNERRQQCEEAARCLNVPALRDANLDHLLEHRQQLSALSFKRAHHVISENDRVLAAVQAMKNNDPISLGRLMNQSHTSLKDDFEVCNDALNTMVEAALTVTGCYGARMTGAGFGGCAVALVHEAAQEDFIKVVSTTYQAQTQLTPKLYASKASNGCALV